MGFGLQTISLAHNFLFLSIRADCEIDVSRPTDRKTLAVLKAFMGLKGPEQLVSHRKLAQVFTALLGHHERDIAKTALQCILRFKSEFMSTYSDKLKLLTADKLRDAMISLKQHHLKIEDCSPSSRHKLAAVLARILFGRISSKSGTKSSKDSPAARRTAVLSFVSGFCTEDAEIFPFLFLALRRYLPSSAERKPIEDFNEDDRLRFRMDLTSVSTKECGMLSRVVHEGFLNVLESIMSQLGHRVIDFVPCFMSLILSVLELYPLGDQQGGQSTEANETKRTIDRPNRVRSLCHSRLADIFEKYSTKFDFTPYGVRMWRCLDKSLKLLPELVQCSDKVPSLLQLLVVLSQNSGSQTQLLLSNKGAVQAGIKCLSRSTSVPVVEAVLCLIENLIEVTTSGDQNLVSDTVMILGLLPDLLHQFETRFELFGMSRSWKRELSVLSNICSLKRKDRCETLDEELDTLAMLLVPFLEFNSKMSDRDRIHIVDILESIIGMISASTSANLYAKLSRLLGPFRTTAGYTALLFRSKLALCIKELGPQFEKSSSDIGVVVVKLSSMNTKTVDELDTDTGLSALKDLSNRESKFSWTSLMKNVNLMLHLLLPVIRICFHCLYSEDGVVVRASLHSLKELIFCSKQLCEETSSAQALSIEQWEKFMEQSIVPMIRAGVCCKEAGPRRFFILLVAEVAQICETSRSPHLLGDLRILVSKEEPDLDFFQNITHVQIHRRSRALSRLCKQILGDSSDEGLFSQQSLSGIIFPIVLHPVYESKTKLEEPLAMEAVATIGAISRRLPWRKFHEELRTLLAQVDRQTQQERVGRFAIF